MRWSGFEGALAAWLIMVAGGIIILSTLIWWLT